MRRRNIAILTVAAIIIIPLAALLIFIASFNPNRYKPQIIAAAERATGRQVAIAGDLRMNLSLSPTISASDITLANPPGFPDATMATLRRIRARVALLPLLGHRIDIVNLTLVDPAITLERNAAGQGNWVFTPAPGAHPAAPVPAHPARRPVIALQAVSIRNGVVTMKQAGAARVLTIARLTARAATLASALHLKAEAAYDGQPFSIAGKTGPLSRFSTGGAGPWPLDAAVSAAGATLHVKGTVAHPRRLAGYDLALAAAIPDLAALDPYAGGYALPPLKSVSFSGNLAQPGGTAPGAIPAVTDARLDIGASDLGTLRPGLRLASLHAAMKSLSSPLSLNA
ncbi:MAG TPA: AsmA family protein, partial [Acetobacteraceae bacterium]|nr:AsmA family protein [Acetobacteraceae bacterium]